MKNEKDISFLKFLKKGFNRFIYHVIWMGQYGMIASESISPNNDFAYIIEFWGTDKFDKVLGTSPYLTKEDVDEFKRCDSVCIIVKDKDRIIASSWMVRGNHYVEELKHTINIGENEFYSCRSFVDPDYRGQRILGHMIHYFAKEYASPEERIWGHIFNWNTSSVNAYKHIGWRHERNVGFTKLLGFKWCRYKSKEALVGYEEDPD